MVEQCFPGSERWLARLLRGAAVAAIGMLLALPSRAAPACPGPAVPLRPLAPGLWAVDVRGSALSSALSGTPGGPGVPVAPAAVDEGPGGAAGEGVRLLVARDGPGLWALGSGPWPAWGRALACQLPRRLGLPLRGVISPLARPEQVLGAVGLPAGVVHLAHEDVAAAMARQCPRCIARWREQLAAIGAPAAEWLPPTLQAAVPTLRLTGGSGRIGPWRWWRLPVGPARTLTLWRWVHGPWWHAPGLLAAEGQPPDGSDSTLGGLREATARALALSATDGDAASWTGGAPARPRPRAALQAQRDYWDGLAQALDQALAEGRPEAAPPPSWPGLPADWAARPRHALNWQRAWREREGLWLDPLEAADAPPAR
jgi:hypothetical protein